MSDDDDGDWAGFADGGFDLFADEAVQEFISPNRSQHPAGRATKLKRPPAGTLLWNSCTPTSSATCFSASVQRLPGHEGPSPTLRTAVQ